jgi:anti-anti-sigma factor
LATNLSEKDSVNSAPIHVTSHKVDTGETQVEVTGDIDLATVAHVDRAIERLGGRVVIDLRKVTFVDSTGINLLLAHRQRLEDSGGHLRILANTAPVIRLLDLAGLSNVFDVDETLHAEAAVPSPLPEPA